MKTQNILNVPKGGLGVIKNPHLTISPVSFTMPKTALFVGEYSKVGVVIDPHSGLTMDDLDFKIPAGMMGGDISLSRDITYNANKPDIMLLGGYKPGAYKIEAYKKGTTTKLSEGAFKVTDTWKDDIVAPKLWFTGALKNYAPSPAWGGGIAGTPQNFNTIPALGTRKVAVLFVDTSDQRYTTDVPTMNGIRTSWKQNLQDGFVGADGISRSVKAYYKEVSYNNLNLAGTVFDTIVNLPNAWSDYFQTDANGSWQAKSQFINQCITAAGDGVDLTGFDMIVCVSQPVDTTTATPKVAWPYGGYGVGVNTSHGMVSGRGVSMPYSWGDTTALDQSNGRTIYETLTHELGHTINLPDEYTPSVPGRNLAGGGSSWDPMDYEGTLPHFCLPHRMMLGWIPAPWVKLYNFQALGSTVDDTFTLHAIELGAPPAGQFAGVEIRIADGDNYYFEYRTGEPMQIGDENLVPNGRVVGIEAVEPPSSSLITRPDLLLLSQHPDDNGAVLDTGQFYHEIDNTSPTFPSDFRVDVISRNASSATIRVRYGVVGKPDPSIRPWPRDAAHQWQSPDIEVHNARSDADPANFANVPWNGHTNTVIATVVNRGTLSAPGVVTKFYVKDFTIGGAPETFLGFDTQNIGPGGTATFQTTWNPPTVNNPHFCIIARIDPYFTPTTPPVFEMTPYNNEAQSNYTQFISASSSPASREITQVTIGNPYQKPTRFFIRGAHNNPLYRTYLETTCVTLKPKEVRKIQVMFEFSPQAFMLDPRFKDDRKNLEKYMQTPNSVSFVGYIENPYDKQLHNANFANGASVQVSTGRATKMLKFSTDGLVAFGEVVTKDNNDMVPDGKAVIAVLVKGNKDVVYITTDVVKGFFRHILPETWTEAQAFYVPTRGFGECESKKITR